MNNSPNFTTKPFSQKVEKPWGYEIILTEPRSPVTGKILHLKAGARFSLQYHDQKEESLTLFNGQAIIFLENHEGILEEITMEKDKGYFISPFQKHRVRGLTDCDIFEVSTPEVGNTFRLEDDYKRSTETQEDRDKQRKL